MVAGRVGMPNVQHDAEHSGQKYRGILDIIRVACTLKQGQTISLAKSAQREMLMTKQWVEDYDLPADIAVWGDSWDAITALAAPVYAR